VVPLAILSAPFTEEERRECARSLRALNLGGKEGGGIRAGNMAEALLRREGGAGNTGGEWRIAGPSLDLAVPEPFPAGEGKVLYRVSPPILGAALILENDGVPDIQIPPLSFRAAAVVNMIYAETAADARFPGSPGRFFFWRMGKPAWLPRTGRTPAPPGKEPR
jgi:hypothetical protein